MAAPAKTAPPPDPPIGGFFGLEPPVSGAHDASDFGGAHRLGFWNARAALAHLLDILSIRRVWLPAYICAGPAEAAACAGREVVYYPVGSDLIPDASVLDSGLRPGDAVLGVDYFGSRSPVLPELAQRFPAVVWIQDRAQALWPDPEPWGTHVLYSPRKVVGAPDGGVLVSRDRVPPPRRWAPDNDLSRLDAAQMRAADPSGADNAAWFAAYRSAEAAMTPAPRPISELSRRVLDGLDTRALATRRRRNAEILLSHIGEASLFDAARLLDGAPLGVPVLTADAAEASRRMARQRIYCARHWAEMPSPAADFPAEHDLSRRLLTLPCDHRYGEAEMLRVADTFLAGR